MITLDERKIRTEWIAVIDGDLKSADLGRALRGVDIRDLDLREPVEFTANRPEGASGYVRYIPLFSTEKDWRWNRDRIFSCYDKYPEIVVNKFLNVYLLSPNLQSHLRKTFGRHFNRFMRMLVRRVKRSYVAIPWDEDDKWAIAMRPRSYFSFTVE